MRDEGWRVGIDVRGREICVCGQGQAGETKREWVGGEGFGDRLHGEG